MTPEIETTGDGSEDVVVTDRELFDQAIAPTPPAEPPAQDQAQEPTPAPEPPMAAGERQRDAHGRFLPQQPPQQQQPDPRLMAQHRVPLREILDEREKRQRAEAEAQQLRTRWQALEQQAAAIQQQQQQPTPPQTIFDAPEQYLMHNVINPLRQEGQMYMKSIKDGFSREMARMQFGPQAEQAINAALADLAQIRYTPQGDVLYNQIMDSGHPYGALVQWHQQRRAHQAIGPNPQAWLQHQRAQWVRDPNMQRAVIEHLRSQQQQQGSRQASNVNLPPSLSSVPAVASSIGSGEMSDESLYAFATKR